MYSARAMVRCLYYLIKRLVWLQKTIRSAQLNLAGSRRAAAKKTFQGSQITVPHDIAVAADLAEGKIGNARDMLGLCWLPATCMCLAVRLVCVLQFLAVHEPVIVRVSPAIYT